MAAVMRSWYSDSAEMPLPGGWWSSSNLSKPPSLPESSTRRGLSKQSERRDTTLRAAGQVRLAAEAPAPAPAAPDDAALSSDESDEDEEDDVKPFWLCGMRRTKVSDSGWSRRKCSCAYAPVSGPFWILRKPYRFN